LTELMRCRSCGYVTEARRVGGVCPACGVPRKMMEPWKDSVSEQRRLFLWLDVHPAGARRRFSPRKKLYGLAFFLFSLSAAAIVFVVGPYAPWARVVDAIVLAAGVVCAVRLGRIGQGLLQAIFPG